MSHVLRPLSLPRSLALAALVQLLGSPACSSGDAGPPGSLPSDSLAAGAAPGSGGTAGTAGTSAGTAGTSPAGAGAPAPAGGAGAAPAPEGGSPAAGQGGSNAAAGAGASGASGSAGAPMEGAAGASGAPAEPPPIACDPADMLPEATVVSLDSIRGSSNAAPIAPAKGPLPPVIEHDPGLDTHTVYRPMELAADTKYPIVVWANGGCIKNGTMFSRFLLEIASHGFVIVADGEPNGSGMGPLETNGEPQKQAMDWIVAENERPCSKFYRKLDTGKIAAMGQSCGGLMTLGASGDERLTTIVIWNSGMFERDQAIYMGLHTPVAYFIGGPDDVAYPQAEADFEAIETVPLFYGNLPVGHSGTYSQDNGGEFAQVGIAWLNWQLRGDMSAEAAGQFVGADCALCRDSRWTVRKKNME